MFKLHRWQCCISGEEVVLRLSRRQVAESTCLSSSFQLEFEWGLLLVTSVSRFWDKGLLHRKSSDSSIRNEGGGLYLVQNVSITSSTVHTGYCNISNIIPFLIANDPFPDPDSVFFQVKMWFRPIVINLAIRENKQNWLEVWFQRQSTTIFKRGQRIRESAYVTY